MKAFGRTAALASTLALMAGAATAEGKLALYNWGDYINPEILSRFTAETGIEVTLDTKRLGTTVLYVTHDQVEAMTLADKIVIMRDGNVEQVGSPEEVYARPRNTFVATFIGSPAMNLVHARVMGGRLQAEAFALTLPDRFVGRVQEGQPVLIGVRPSDVAIAGPEQPASLAATVEVTEFLGDDALLDLRVGPHELIAQVPANQRPEADQVVHISFALDRMHLFDAASGQSLLF